MTVLLSTSCTEDICKNSDKGMWRERACTKQAEQRGGCEKEKSTDWEAFTILPKCYIAGPKLISLGKGSCSDHLNVMKHQPPFLAPSFMSRKDSDQTRQSPKGDSPD